MVPEAFVRRVAALVLALLALWTGSAAAALPGGAPPRIGVATMAPGEVFFERFGHNAIIVEDPATGETWSYNFGMFDMGEDGFVGRFVDGQMVYRLAKLRWEEDLANYQRSGRGVTIQWLRLTPGQAVALASALEENARPENAAYRYDYFLDNCATRVRDALDKALGGLLQRQMSVRSAGDTFRSEAVRLASPAPWMALGFDFGLGPSSDRPLSRWEDAYVPMRLADSLADVRLPDGRPLVNSEVEVAPHLAAPEPLEFQRLWWAWLLSGLVASVAWWQLRKRSPRVAALLVGAFWLVSAVLGTVMALLWVGTEHRFAWANRNLFLASPLMFLLLPGAWAMLRGRTPGRGFRIALALACAGVVVGLFGYWLAALPQANAHWIALALPLYGTFAMAWLVPPERSPA